jgi:hypothetical protein
MALLDADEMERDSLLGEDTWELFETIEDSFGVDLGDYRALLGMTVRELAEEISKRVDYPDRERCLSAVAFYKLRRTFEVQFDIPRATIRPATPVGDLLPWKSRKQRWRILQENLGLTVPGLAFPSWVFYPSLMAPAALLISLRLFWGFPLNAILIFWGSFLLIIPSVFVFSPFARKLPPGSETFGGLAKIVLARNYAAFAKQHGRLSENDVLPALRQLIATQTFQDIENVPTYTLIPQGLNIY